MTEPALTRISFSEFNLYRNCGHKHLLEKYLKLISRGGPNIHLYFGTAMHAALEGWMANKNTIKNGLDSAIKEFETVLSTAVYKYLSHTPELPRLYEYIMQGKAILRVLDIEGMLEDCEIVGVEYELYEPLFGQYVFIGFVDLILYNTKTGKYIIIDWKTATYPWNLKYKLADKRFIAQQHLYKYFFSVKRGVALSDIETKYIVLCRHKTRDKDTYGAIQDVPVVADDNTISDSLNLLIKTAVDINETNVFTKAKFSRNKSHCRFCEHKNNPIACNEDEQQYKELLSAYSPKSTEIAF